MPKIRSITCFGDDVERAGNFIDGAAQAFEHAGVSVQTRRFATSPFPRWISQPQAVAETAHHLFARCMENGIEYLSIGPVGSQDDPDYVTAIAEVFRSTPGVFATVNIADKQNGISLRLLQQTATLIDDLSRITSDGMTNLYLAAIANCAAGSPFFPVAYHDGGAPGFALAIQAADLAVTAFSEAASLPEARQKLTEAIQHYADVVVPVAETLAAEHDQRFGGLDFSLAPYPLPSDSLGGALEALGPVFGGAGLVASASLIMNAIEGAVFPRTGFSGLMLPILEDSVLADRAAERRLTLNDLLLLSAVCGTGLDCIPLPGDISVISLRDILLDVGALALRLNKPLTARLMPFPGKQAGDVVSFEFEYFANSRVLSAPLPSSLQGDSDFDIMPRI